MLGEVKNRFNISNISKCFMLFSQGSKKRGQQSSFGMSFGMLFSIFLIIVFFAAAFMIIKVFLGIGQTANYGQFYADLQKQVDRSWRSTDSIRYMDLDLPKEIEYICFANLSADITAHQDLYDDYLRDYKYDIGVNTFLLPPGVAKELDKNEIKHLDIPKMTETSNPYCISNPSEMTITKGTRSKFVTVS